MEVVYPYRGGYRMGPDPLKWSLRTLAQHCEVRRLVIAGTRPPPWLALGVVEWLEVPFPGHKREHTGRILEAVLASDIGDEFVWFNDDFFLLADRDDFPLWGEARLRDKIESLPGGDKNQYRNGLIRQLELLEGWGFEDPPSLDLHRPLPIDKAKMAAIYARGRLEAPELPAGFFRSLYVASGLEVTVTHDAKIYETTDPIPDDAELVSTSPLTWAVGQVGKRIRDRYYERSVWER